MVEFYTKLLGFEVVWQHHIRDSEDVDAVVGVKNASMRTAMLRTGNCFVELFEYVNPAATAASERTVYEAGYRHFALEVVGIEEEYERLRTAGVEFLSVPRDFGNVKGVYAYDPDRNIFELQEVIHPDLPFHITRAGGLIAGARDDLETDAVHEQGQLLQKMLSGTT
jgi:catechol 2,3-dioxygenase-like lactoylglutathione lyase family enzyme